MGMWQSAAKGGARCIGHNSPEGDGSCAPAGPPFIVPAPAASTATALSSARRFIFMGSSPGAFLATRARCTACTGWRARSTVDFAGAPEEDGAPPLRARGRHGAATQRSAPHGRGEPYPPPRCRDGRGPGRPAVPWLAGDLVILAPPAGGAGRGGVPRAGAAHVPPRPPPPPGAARGLHSAPYRPPHGGGAGRARKPASGDHRPRF